jgi:uncharacterized membrane protein YeiH
VGPDLSFRLPLYFEYGATLLWALTGALVAARRGYDVAGLMVLAIVSSAGGGLLRDGIFINQGPPLFLRSPVFVTIAVATALIVWAAGHRLDRLPHLDRSILLLDAVGIGAFGLVGLQISLRAGLALPAAVFVGVVNAVGGEVLRDVLTRREPTIFKPGVPSALAALAGCLVFLGLVFPLRLPGGAAGPVAVAVVFLIRVAALRFNVRTRPALGYIDPSERARI